jgi:leucyl aminopeptidase
MLGDFVVEQGKKYGFEAEFLLEKELKKQGFHALLAIGQGSVEDSAFIIMKYRGTKSKATDIGLVGKGITFDTGGISIKPSDNMHFMKSDMGGAAMMIGTMMAVAALNLPINITAVVPSAENMPSGNAVKPSDVFSSYSGKTIEMIDTDAEGRVVLADGLAWMVKNEKPEIMLDAATLTGSIVRSLGSKAAGLFSNNTDLVSRLISSGEHTGERLWPMPLWDDYLDEIASDVADVRNFSGVPTAGAISAAKFLEVFTDKHPAWAHMDIAGVAFGTNPYTKMRSATGFGIKLLVDFIEKSVK